MLSTTLFVVNIMYIFFVSPLDFRSYFVQTSMHNIHIPKINIIDQEEGG